MSTPLINVRKVNKHFGSAHVLKDLSTHFHTGEVTVIVGSSGSGKSTLLRTLNRLEKHDSGEIVIDGIPVNDDSANLKALHAQVGMVFQQFNLFPHLTALDNVSLAPRRVWGLAPKQANDQAMVLLDRVGLSAHANKHPFALSGGQQQRVAIARALAMQPRIMLFDEPTSALDPEMVKEVLDVMKALAQSGMTMLVVTHEMGFAREVADRILYLDQGCVLQDSPPAPFFDQQDNPRIRGFLGRMLH